MWGRRIGGPVEPVQPVPALVHRLEELQRVGRLVDPRLARSIYDGETYSGVVEHLPLSHWRDDLTDVEHKWTSREGSKKASGKIFVAAQDIIQEMLSRASA